jgi:hypothetical protein
MREVEGKESEGGRVKRREKGEEEGKKKRKGSSITIDNDKKSIATANRLNCSSSPVNSRAFTFSCASPAALSTWSLSRG